jgi:nitroimidazol reductase NimA-like FMN-containing flavoprotein (pyridoxamine 5'-phosphate oxidase superfamily)
LATTRADGRPHVVPVDGLWLDDAWYYGGSPETVHSRTVQANPRVVVHIGDGATAVIVEGEVVPTRQPPEMVRRLEAASRAKYGYAPPPGAYETVRVLHPRRVLAWTAFPTDATRFRFRASAPASPPPARPAR